MNKVKFSVLLSIYYKEKPEYFRECMESIYSQTVLPDEIVLVEDGRLTEELYEAISDYECRPSEINFVTVKLEKNSGLGLALAEGIKHCSNELVARMDTDDICVPDRFEIQLNAFSENPGLDIIGGYISEFSEDMHNIISERTVPLGNNEIKQYKRNCLVYGQWIIVYAGAVWGSARFMLSDQEKFAIFLGTYLLTGYGAFQKLSEEIMEKRFPVEYILVIFATIGAFGIGKYMEAVVVMLMFELGMLAEQIATDRTKRSIA